MAQRSTGPGSKLLAIPPVIALLADLIAIISLLVIDGSDTGKIRQVAIVVGLVSALAAGGYLLAVKNKTLGRKAAAVVVVLVGLVAAGVGVVQPGEASTGGTAGSSTPPTSATPTTTTTTAPSVSSSAPASSAVSSEPQLDPRSRYLSDPLPTEVKRSGGYRAGAAVLDNQSYPKSMLVTCGLQAYFVFPTYGAKSFEAVFGVDDTATNAYQTEVTFALYDSNENQVGEPVVVSVGNPTKRSFDVSATRQMKLTCSAINLQTKKPRDAGYVVLGDAVYRDVP